MNSVVKIPGDISGSIKVQSIKCMIVGDSEVGKTCLFKKLLGDMIPSEYTATVFDVINKDVTYSENGVNHKINLTLWDSAGSKLFDSIRPISYANTDCFIVCYGINDKTSFDNVENRWLPELLRHGDGPRVPVILVANYLHSSQKSTKGHGDKVIDGQNGIGSKAGEEMMRKVGARVFFEHTSQADVSSLLKTAVRLSYLKKLEDEEPPDPVWKFQAIHVLVAGDQKVGKTSLIRTFIKETSKFQEPIRDSADSNGFQVYYNNVVMEGCEYFLRITELPLNELSISTFSSESEEVKVFVLCYAVDDPFSYQAISRLCRHLQSFVHQIPLILIANKSDLKNTSDILVPTEDGEEIKAEMKCAEFIECSAQTSEKVSKLLQLIIDLGNLKNNYADLVHHRKNR